MTVVALAETRTFWAVALGMGAVVLAEVVVLMALLLSFLRDIFNSVTRLLEVGGEVAQGVSAMSAKGHRDANRRAG